MDRIVNKEKTSGAGRKTIIAVLEVGEKGIDVESLVNLVYGVFNQKNKIKLSKVITSLKCRYSINIVYDRVTKRYYWSSL